MYFYLFHSNSFWIYIYISRKLNIAKLILALYLTHSWHTLYAIITTLHPCIHICIIYLFINYKHILYNIDKLSGSYNILEQSHVYGM